MNGGSDTLVYAGLGSNIGDRVKHLHDAMSRIGEIPGTTMLRVSPVYESSPWGFAAQAYFLNAVLEFRTTLEADQLFRHFKAIETSMGRMPAKRNHPRIVDLDILLFGQLTTTGGGLEIPHPRMTERRFVLQPLCDLDPALRHPFLQKSMHELCVICPDTGTLVLHTEQLKTAFNALAMDWKF